MAAFTLTGTRGDDNQYDIAVTVNGSVMDLTSCLLWFTGKFSYSDPDPGIFQVRSDGSNASGQIVITDAANGKAQLTLTPAATQSLDPNQIVVADLQLKDGGGKVTTVAAGTILFEGDVTLTTT